MLVKSSILPLLLLLIQGVTSDVKNIRLPRRHFEVIRSHGLNYPLPEDNHVFNPVSVADKKVLHIRKKNMKIVNIVPVNPDIRPVTEDSATVSEDINPVNKDITPESKEHNIWLQHIRDSEDQFVYIPPSHDYIPMTVRDYDRILSFNPKTRSINNYTPETGYSAEISEQLESPEIYLEETQKDKRHKIKTRKSQYIRKIRITREQLDEYVNEAESSLKHIKSDDTQTEQSVPNVEIKQTRFSERTSTVPKRNHTFQKRKQLRDPYVPIIDSQNYVFAHSGDFHYSYEGGDGTKASERGELRNSNGGAGSAVEGSFSYKDKDGNDFSLTYTADENGYRPVGAHLPTPPPIPPAIQRALEILATKTTPEPITERIRKM